MTKKQEQKRHTDNKISEIFCAENGYLSSKRVLGAVVLLSCLVLIIVEAIKEGITDNIKDLVEILIITSTALLGITSITGIWKNKNINNKSEE